MMTMEDDRGTRCYHPKDVIQCLLGMQYIIILSFITLDRMDILLCSLNKLNKLCSKIMIVYFCASDMNHDGEH